MTPRSPGAWRAGSIAAAACLWAWSPAEAAAPAEPAGVATCVACHGTHGEGNVAGVPRLAGQSAAYLERALSAFKAGTRSSPIMQPVAGALTDAQIHAFASYFAALHAPPSAMAPPPPELVAAGERLARVGALADPTPACFSCHGTAGEGNGRSPGIAGQPAAFIVKRLEEFRARARAAPPEPATMTAVAARLDDEQIRQAAAYLSTLPGP